MVWYSCSAADAFRSVAALGQSRNLATMTRHEDQPRLAELLRRTDAIADGESTADNIPTGFPTLDRLLGGGLRRGDLIVLGGDVGTGKSALALAIALQSGGRGACGDISQW